MKQSKILWFTGLSGSGKSTIAEALCKCLEAKKISLLLLDGDSVRSNAHRHLKFTPDDIRENNRLIACRCKDNIDKYDVIIVSAISPFRISRDRAREFLHPHFSEVFIKTRLEECIRRDVKGLYKRALNGEIENFIGLSPNTPYEEPLAPDLILDTENASVDECVLTLLRYLNIESGGRDG